MVTRFLFESVGPPGVSRPICKVQVRHTTQIIFHTADVYTRLVWYVNMRLAKFTTPLLAVGPSKPSLNWLMVTESVCSYLLTGAKPISSDGHGATETGNQFPVEKKPFASPSIESRENTF
jgi:hypothetical protein